MRKLKLVFLMTALPLAAAAQGVNPPVAPNIPAPTTQGSLYGGNSELFAGGSYQFAKATTANSQTVSTTNVGGVQLGYRYHATDSSAVEVRLALATPTQLYGPSTIVKSRDIEFSLDYVFTIPTDGKVRPFFLGGGGLIHYAPTGSGNTPGASTQKRLALNYGAGLDFNLSPHLGIRFEYRGLIYRVPDFNLITISKWNHMPEPDIGLVWHF